MNRKLFWIWIAFILMGCGVKKNDPGATHSNLVSTGKSGVYLSQKGEFIVQVTPNAFLPDTENAIHYKIYKVLSLEPFRISDLTYKTLHKMPKMPEMVIPKVLLSINNTTNEVEGNYYIAHGGLWEFSLSIYRDGKLVDKIIFQSEVPHT